MPLRALVALVAGPRQWSDTRESWLARAARKSGVSYRTIKALFYREITDEKHLAARALRQAAARERTQALASRFEEIARGLSSRDADFHREDVRALVDAARALRGLDRAGDGER